MAMMSWDLMGIWVYKSDWILALTSITLRGGNRSVEVVGMGGGKTGDQCGGWRPAHCSILVGTPCKQRKSQFLGSSVLMRESTTSGCFSQFSDNIRIPVLNSAVISGDVPLGTWVKEHG